MNCQNTANSSSTECGPPLTAFRQPIQRVSQDVESLTAIREYGLGHRGDPLHADSPIVNGYGITESPSLKHLNTFQIEAPLYTRSPYGAFRVY